MCIHIEIHLCIYKQTFIHLEIYLYDNNVPLAGRGLRVRFLLLASTGAKAEADVSAAEADADKSDASLVLCSSPAHVWCKWVPWLVHMCHGSFICTMTHWHVTIHMHTHVCQSCARLLRVCDIFEDHENMSHDSLICDYSYAHKCLPLYSSCARLLRVCDIFECHVSLIMTYS